MLFHVRDTEGRFHLPFVYALELKRDPETFSPLYVQRTDQRYPVALFVRGDEYRLWNLFTWDVHLFGVKGEQRLHLFRWPRQPAPLDCWFRFIRITSGVPRPRAWSMKVRHDGWWRRM